mmetsp:Transcript_16467/g.45915  ORF Transcript_16467/g.45915 Transcript_16467/m.45915 type:complete len:433 (-) Transcript_16467:1103-2401(-)
MLEDVRAGKGERLLPGPLPQRGGPRVADIGGGGAHMPRGQQVREQQLLPRRASAHGAQRVVEGGQIIVPRKPGQPVRHALDDLQAHPAPSSREARGTGLVGRAQAAAVAQLVHQGLFDSVSQLVVNAGGLHPLLHKAEVCVELFEKDVAINIGMEGRQKLLCHLRVARARGHQPEVQHSILHVASADDVVLVQVKPLEHHPAAANTFLPLRAGCATACASQPFPVVEGNSEDDGAGDGEEHPHVGLAHDGPTGPSSSRGHPAVHSPNRPGASRRRGGRCRIRHGGRFVLPTAARGLPAEICKPVRHWDGASRRGGLLGQLLLLERRRFGGLLGSLGGLPLRSFGSLLLSLGCLGSLPLSSQSGFLLSLGSLSSCFLCSLGGLLLGLGSFSGLLPCSLGSLPLGLGSCLLRILGGLLGSCGILFRCGLDHLLF